MRKLPFVFAYLLIVASVMVGAPPPSPMKAVREWDAKIRSILERPALKKADREAQLKAAVIPLLDYETHTRESLSPHWDQMSAPERSTAIRAITVLLEQSSVEKVRNILSQQVEYLSENFDTTDPESASVRARVRKDRDVAFRMRWAEGRWRIFDIVIEGASSVESNRTAFSREIKSSGISGLLEKLERKAKQKS